jgi:hypothetical protein
MNVTMIKNGCKVTSHNGLTSALVNNYACTEGFSCLPILKCDACPVDGDIEYWREAATQVENYPWWDKNNPFSAEYLGTYITSVDGLFDTFKARDVQSNINGSFASVCRDERREIVVSGIMFALSDEGMAFGRAWEQARWWGASCDCCVQNVSFRAHCPRLGGDDCDGLYTVGSVVTTAGPSYTDVYESGRCAKYMKRFEVTLNALDSGFYSCPSCVLPGDVFDLDAVREVSWVCDEPVEDCLPLCCDPCVDDPFSNLFVPEPSCCWCQPLFVSERCFTFPGVVQGSSMVFDVDVFAGSGVFENARVLFVEGDCLTGDACVDSCGVMDVSDRRVLGGFEIAAMPAGSMLRVDGVSGRVRVSCDGGWQDGSRFLFGLGGVPYQRPMVDFCGPFSVIVEVDGFTVPEDAWVRICSINRYLSI